MEKIKEEVPEKLRIAVLLSFISGYINAFTYNNAGELFAGAQTGNVIFMALHFAKGILEKEGYYLEYITSGSTPTFTEAVKDLNINVYHPGNYVFLDSIQLSINRAKIKDCALTVLATIISHPSEDLFICDAGAKCLGLDQGAHGNSSIVGYGTVINHPELIVSSLSEEVGKLKVKGETNLKIGDKIEIIPNHSCSTANLCTYYTVVDGDDVIKSIKVDARGNSIKRI